MRLIGKLHVKASDEIICLGQTDSSGNDCLTLLSKDGVVEEIPCNDPLLESPTTQVVGGSNCLFLHSGNQVIRVTKGDRKVFHINSSVIIHAYSELTNILYSYKKNGRYILASAEYNINIIDQFLFPIQSVKINHNGRVFVVILFNGKNRLNLIYTNVKNVYRNTFSCKGEFLGFVSEDTFIVRDNNYCLYSNIGKRINIYTLINMQIMGNWLSNNFIESLLFDEHTFFPICIPNIGKTVHAILPNSQNILTSELGKEFRIESVNKFERTKTRIVKIKIESTSQEALRKCLVTGNSLNKAIFLPGGPGIDITDSYHPMVGMLNELGYEVWIPELAGSNSIHDVNGRSSWGLVDSVELKNVINYLRSITDKSIILVGHSYGGYLALTQCTNQNINNIYSIAPFFSVNELWDLQSNTHQLLTKWGLNDENTRDKCFSFYRYQSISVNTEILLCKYDRHLSNVNASFMKNIPSLDNVKVYVLDAYHAANHARDILHISNIIANKS